MDEDAVLLALGNLQGEMKGYNNRMDGIGREIGEIKDALKCKSEDCITCRKEIDAKCDELKTTTIRNEGVQLGKSTVVALIFAAIGGVYGIIMVALAVWKALRGG